MVKLIVTLPIILGLIACGQANKFNGQGKSKRASKGIIHQQQAKVEEILEVGETLSESADATIEQSDVVAVEDANEVLVESELKPKEVLSLGSCDGLDLEQNVILVEDNSADLSSLSVDSIILVRPRGNEEIEISIASDTVTSIKGLCIDSRGSAEIEINLLLTINNFSYYGRGSGESELKFSSDALLSNAKSLDVDVNGNHELEIKGVTIECHAIKKSEVGNSPLVCSPIN